MNILRVRVTRTRTPISGYLKVSINSQLLTAKQAANLLMNIICQYIMQES